MKTLAQLFPLPKAELLFAGFSFPRNVAMLARGSRADRVRNHSEPLTGPYYHTPTPNSKGVSFHLESDFAPKLRWKWADDVCSLGHTGWFTNCEGEGQTIRGIVMRLPQGRGFLAGWSMGEKWASFLDTSFVYEDEQSAARTADSLAEHCAEEEIIHAEEFKDEDEEDEAA